MGPAITAILALLPLIKTGNEALLQWLEQRRKAMQQTGEWTSEQETLWQAGLREVGPEHAPDPPGL